MAAGITSAGGILSLLDEPEIEVQEFALAKLNEVVDNFWAEVSDKIEKIEILYEDESFAKRGLAALVASKVYYHLGEFQDSMTYALGAGEYFDVNLHTEYVHTIIAMCIDTYATAQQQQSNGDSAGDPPSAALVDVVERMFERCFTANEYKQAAGIALETRRLDILQRSILESSDANVMLDYCFSVSMTLIVERKFRDQVLGLIAQQYARLPKVNYFKMCQCYIYLGDGTSTGKILSKLTQAGDESLAYQLAFDLYDSATQQFLSTVCDTVSGSAADAGDGSGTVAAVADEGAASTENSTSNKVDDAAGDNKITKNILDVLTGTHTLPLSVEFMSRNNHADKLLMTQIKDSVGRNSICHNATVMCNSVMYAGTTSDVFLRENEDWLRQANNWARFNAAAGLGVIYKGHTTEAMHVLEPYLPKDGGGDGGPYVTGGGLYALGLIYANHGGEVTQYFLDKLREPNVTEVTQHGGCLGLGLASMGSGREDVYNQLRDCHLYVDSAVAGEAAGIAMGLVMLGSGDSDGSQEMARYARETQHEKIIRGLALGLALVMYGRQSQADKQIDDLITDKDPILRMGAVHTISTAYVGTGENRIIKRLLHVSVSDVSDDVRRCAVTALGFVLCRTPEQLPSTVMLLSESFNPHVRHGTCMALGVAFAATGNIEALSLLEPLFKDAVGHVRQGAMIALALIMMQQPASHPKYKTAQELFKTTMNDKHEDILAKFGAIYACGIMAAGGQNVTTALVNGEGHIRLQSVVGMLVFTQFWFWFPLGHFLSLAMTPTTVICLNKNLKMPKIELKSNAPKSKFAYPPHTEPPKEKSKDKVKTVVLSTTSKSIAKKKKLEGSKDADGAAMNVDDDSSKPDSSSKNNTDKKQDDSTEKKDADSSEKKDGGAEEDNKKEEDPPFTIVANPARVVLKQLPVMELPADSRYKPVVPGHLHFVTILDDGTPEEPEDVIEIAKPKTEEAVEEEEEAEMPAPFEFNEELEDE